MTTTTTKTSVVYTAVASQTLFDITFDYLSKSFVQVYLNDVLQEYGTNYDFLSSGQVRFLNGNLVAGDLIKLQRATDGSKLLVSFKDASVLTAHDLDVSTLQVLHIAEEALEIPSQSLLRDSSINFDALGLRIKHLGSAIANTDAANLGDVKNQVGIEEAARLAADINLQKQISGEAPKEASPHSPINWHKQVIESSVEIPAGVNAWSVGPKVTIAEGQVVRVAEGSNYTVVDGVQEEGPLVFENDVTQTDLSAVKQEAATSLDAAKTLLAQAISDVSTSLADLDKRKGKYAVSADWFGLTAGGDAGLALKKAHDAGYTRIEFSPGKYKWITPVTITAAMEIYGVGYSETPNADRGTWFELATAGATALTFSGSSARGSTIGKAAFWETNHPSEVAGWAPVNNDFVIKVTDVYGRVTFDDIFMLRVNKGVSCYNSGRMHFKKITGQWYTNAITIDKCLDVPVIDLLHHWTFYTSTNVVLQYQQANLDVLTLKRCDGAFLGNIFTFGQRSAIRLSSSADGVATKIYCNSLYTDFAFRSLWIEAGANGSNVLIAGLTTHGEAWPSAGVGVPGGSAFQVDANDCNIQVGNLHTQRYYDTPIKVTGLRNRIDIGSAWFELSNQANNGSPIINLADNTSTAAFGGVVRIDNSNSAPLVNANIGSVLSALMANRGNAATDEPRPFWGAGECGLAALSPNAAADFSIAAKGQSGSVKLKANGKTIARFDDGNGTALSGLLFRANAASFQLFAEGSAANVDILITPKGNGVVIPEKPVKFPGYAFASVPSVSVYKDCTIRISDRSNRLATSDGTNWRFTDGTVIS